MLTDLERAENWLKTNPELRQYEGGSGSLEEYEDQVSQFNINENYVLFSIVKFIHDNEQNIDGNRGVFGKNLEKANISYYRYIHCQVTNPDNDKWRWTFEEFMERFHGSVLMLLETKAANVNLVYGEAFISLTDEMNALVDPITRKPWPNFVYE